MRPVPRLVVQTASVCAVAAAVFVSIAWGTEPARTWLLIPGLTAIALSVSSVVADPRELLAALVLGAAPAMGLADPEANPWLIGPVAVMLLVGGELNSWSWELVGQGATGRDDRRRLAGIMRTAAVGLVASLGVSLAARLTLLGGLGAVTVAAAALALLARVLLHGERRPVRVAEGDATPDRTPRGATPPGAGA